MTLMWIPGLRCPHQLQRLVSPLGMRTHLAIDDALLCQAMQASGARSKREVVELALRTLVRLNEQGAIRCFRGRLQWEGRLDDQRLDDQAGRPTPL